MKDLNDLDRNTIGQLVCEAHQTIHKRTASLEVRRVGRSWLIQVSFNPLPLPKHRYTILTVVHPMRSATMDNEVTSSVDPPAPRKMQEP